MPAKQEKKICGRIKVQPILPPLPVDKFYASVKKNRGQKENHLPSLFKKHQGQLQQIPIGLILLAISFAFYPGGTEHEYLAVQLKLESPPE